ncbi:dihydromonapterin reductase [Thiomicrorhabdus aquaedulcis]|uniref:dihydromonapterin reductase n=1 Tax=Thiomicrorhabdus aquaedulcis TaxID=2211106 RepID=UPI000FD7A2F0|nr:dihydromonapterin reductase [Thiomicrorhabdus aquaedulcis]
MNRLQNGVFITGAGQRIGAFLVQQFLTHTNYPVVFTYRTAHPQVAQLQAMGAVGIQVDFNQPHAIEAMLTQLHNQVDSLRCVIHNASQWLSDDDWPLLNAYTQLFKVHVEVPYALNQALHGLLLASSSPLKDIISISDFSVARPSVDHIAYLASKAAMQSMSKGFAKKYAPHIKVNDLAPALILFNEGDSADYKTKRLAQSALGIEPGAEVVWQAVEYLMNNNYTTGTVLNLDGGRGLM